MIDEVEKVYHNFLEDLREGGTVNMWGASGFLLDAFDLTKAEARAISLRWMKGSHRKL